jgi:hypothetical protein
MRTGFTATVFLTLTTALCAQAPPEPQTRYGMKARLKQYPQETPKDTLKSVLTAIEGQDFSYLVAHLLDPKFVDDAVKERAQELLPTAERDLLRLREFQRANRDRIDPADRLPFDPQEFRQRVEQKARELGFQQLVQEVARKLADDLQTVRVFRRVLANGSFGDAGMNAAATHPDLKNRAIFFTKIGNRWFIENRQAEARKEP